MTVPAFSGYLLLSCGPPLAAGLPFFWHRSLLSLTVVSSMFAWLALLIFTSALFRAFVPLEDTVVGYLPLVLVPVIIEECARIGFWYMHKSAGTHLKQLADTASVRYSPLDELALSYSVGWGHAATHMLFQFGPFLPLTWNTATAYSTHCVNLSLFSVSVLTQLGIFGVLAGGHVVFIYGMTFKQPALAVLPAAMHVTAALLTLNNFSNDGCYTSIPIILALGICMAMLAYVVAWKVSIQSRSVRTHLVA